MSKFNRIAQDSPQFQKALEVFNQMGDRFDYDGMAGAYNELTQGEILSFEYKKGKAAVVASQLEKRGLVRGADFDVRSAANEGSDTATVMIQRNSAKTAGAAQHAPRGRKAKGTAPGAPEAATDAPAAAADAPAPGKGKGK